MQLLRNFFGPPVRHLSHVHRHPWITAGDERHTAVCGKHVGQTAITYEETETTCEHCLAILRADKAQKAAIRHAFDCGDYAVRDPDTLAVIAEARRTRRRHRHLGH